MGLALGPSQIGPIRSNMHELGCGAHIIAQLIEKKKLTNFILKVFCIFYYKKL